MFWLCIREHLSKHELQRYLTIKGITTDAGRGRAWLRSAINEHSLERYVHLLLGNETLLRCKNMYFLLEMKFTQFLYFSPITWCKTLVG